MPSFLFGGPTAVAFDIASNPVQQTSSQATVKPVQSPTERDIINTEKLWTQQLNDAAGIQPDEVRMVNAENATSNSSEVDTYQDNAGGIYTADDTLRNHIENGEGTTSRRRGVRGAHVKDSFMQNDILIVSSTTHPQIPGVEIIEYRMPKCDKTGTPIPGAYQAGDPLKKTVYNPNVFNTEEYIRRGMEAANNAATLFPNGVLPSIWDGYDNEGVRWRGYYREGKITSFYPD